jgi:hypothetical protein
MCRSGRHGFVVAITGVEEVGKGLIREGTGFVTFPVKYQCVVFRPFKGEILEAVVTMVNKVEFYSTVVAFSSAAVMCSPLSARFTELRLLGSADGVLRGGWACADLRVKSCE